MISFILSIHNKESAQINVEFQQKNAMLIEMSKVYIKNTIRTIPNKVPKTETELRFISTVSRINNVAATDKAAIIQAPAIGPKGHQNRLIRYAQVHLKHILNEHSHLIFNTIRMPNTT